MTNAIYNLRDQPLVTPALVRYGSPQDHHEEESFEKRVSAWRSTRREHYQSPFFEGPLTSQVFDDLFLSTRGKVELDKFISNNHFLYTQKLTVQEMPSAIKVEYETFFVHIDK
ncbi:MAG: hypothetical protein ABIJ08_04040 [Nanoarchaeota archaeon]